MKIFLTTKKQIYLYIIVSIANTSYARPQYSAAKGINDCTACHYSPAGGGPKTVFGKTTASHGFTPSPRSMSDSLGGDVRAMALSTTKNTSKNPMGVSIMSGNISGAIDIVNNDRGVAHIVASYDFLGYSSQAKEAYVRWEAEDSELFLPQYIVVGKFNIPFGILTDEHRTYVRMQTFSSQNEYEMGGMLSGNLTDSTHYDLAFVQGFQQGSRFPGNGTQWGVVLNTRMMFQDSHLYIGTSGFYYKNNNLKSPWAAAAYMVWSPTQKFSFMAEIDFATNLNDTNILNSYLTKFVSSSLSSTYYNYLIDKKSLGALVRFDYTINSKWTIYNKIDFLAPDQSFLKDNYINNGIGFKYFINSNIDIDCRFEKTFVSRDGIQETQVSASKDRIMAIGHVWF